MTKLSDFFNTLVRQYVSKQVQAIEECERLSELFSSVVSKDMVILTPVSSATVQSKLTKQDLDDFNFLTVNVCNFFKNTSFSQADYVAILHRIQNGNEGATEVQSQAIENYGNRAVQLANLMQEIRGIGVKISETYFKTFFNVQVDALAAVNPGLTVYGTTNSAGALTQGISLIDNWNSLMESKPANQSDWSGVIRNWDANI